MPAPLTPLSPFADGARRIVPHATVLLLLVLSLTPLPFLGSIATGALHITPPLTLIGVAFWSVQRPDRFSIIAAFIIGLLQDLLMGVTPGVTAFLYAFIHRLAFRQHHMLRGLSFMLLWSAYGAMQIVFSFVQWGVWSWMSQPKLPLGPFLVQACIGILLFPAIAWGLHRIQIALAGRAL